MSESRIDALASKLAELETEVAQLRRLATFRRQIGLIDFGELRGFMYVDDLGYQQTRPEQRTGDIQRTIADPLPKDIATTYDDRRSTLLEILFCHHWLHGLEFTVLDIGCQYGFSAISTARNIQAFGKSNLVIAFDPGVAAELVPHNLLMNGMESRIRFERMAISKTCGPRIVYTELEHSENNRIVNRTQGQEAISYAVMATSLDAYCRFPGHLIVKIDTQGAEPEVFGGMAQLLADRLVTAVTEFTPHAMATQVQPAEWLAHQMELFHVFDAGHLDLVIGPGHQVHKVELAGFVERVDASPSRYTDLLMVPRHLPAVNELLSRILAGSTV